MLLLFKLLNICQPNLFIYAAHLVTKTIHSIDITTARVRGKLLRTQFIFLLILLTIGRHSAWARYDFKKNYRQFCYSIVVERKILYSSRKYYFQRPSFPPFFRHFTIEQSQCMRLVVTQDQRHGIPGECRSPRVTLNYTPQYWQRRCSPTIPSTPHYCHFYPLPF